MKIPLIIVLGCTSLLLSQTALSYTSSSCQKPCQKPTSYSQQQRCYNTTETKSSCAPSTDSCGASCSCADPVCSNGTNDCLSREACCKAFGNPGMY